MLTILLEIYITLIPAILAGVFNMIWCKLPVALYIKKPMDAGKTLKDGRRIFGDNKTWKGFVGMIFLGCIFGILWGMLCKNSEYMSQHNYLYRNMENTLLYNTIMGAFIGFAYAVFELPNSFIKRRLDIRPGMTTTGFRKVFFIFLDQADSIFGCVLVVCTVYPMSVGFYFIYVLIGAFTHIIFNMFLYLVKLRKNMF